MNKNRSPIYRGKEKENPIIEKTYNIISNWAGNIFLD